MSELQKIKIDDTEYYIVNDFQNLRAEDSFIHNQNKLEEYKGKGEARKYIGSYKNQKDFSINDFFDYDKWGDVKKEGERTYPTIQNKNCFFSKNNLLKYLDDAKVEYEKQEQIYKEDIFTIFETNLQKIKNLKSNMNFFSIYDVSDFIDSPQNRAYIRSDDNIWDTWRKLILPKISYLSILKQ
jgi:putative restriction endonuclease